MALSTDISFGEGTKVIKTGNGVWKGFVSKEFRVGNVANGGYLMAIICNALKRDQDEQCETGIDSNSDLINASLLFLRSGMLDEDCEVRISGIKRGKTTSVLSFDLLQQGKSRIQGYATFGKFQDSGDSSAPEWLSKGVLSPDFSLLKQQREYKPPHSSGGVKRSTFQKYKWFFTDREAEKMDAIILAKDIKLLGKTAV